MLSDSRQELQKKKKQKKKTKNHWREVLLNILVNMIQPRWSAAAALKPALP